MSATLPLLRYLTVIAQDPLLTYKREGPNRGRIVTAQVRIAAESLGRGPSGYRIHAVVARVKQPVAAPVANLYAETQRTYFSSYSST